MPLPVTITFKITRGYFKQPPSAFLLTDLQALAGAQNWSRCNVKSHKTLLLSRIPVHPERGGAEKTLHQGDTSAEWGWRGGPFIVSMCLRERKVSQRPFHCSGKAAWGTQAKALTLQGDLPPEKSWGAPHWDVP